MLEKEKQVAEQVKELRKDYLTTIERLIDKIGDWLWNDPVTNVYAAIFTDDVLFSPALDKETIAHEADKRKRYKMPPGYKDYREGDLVSRNPAGDLIIRFSILELASRGKDVIFVSLEQKADWWHRSGGEAGTILYPRYELVEEFRRKSQGKSFHMLPLSSLLKLFGADEAVVEEVKDEETKIGFTHSRFSEADLWPLILNWLKGFYPSCEVSTASDFHDFTVDCEKGKRTIVDYFISANTENFPRYVHARAHNLQTYIDHFNLQGGVLLVVSQSADEAFFVERTYTPSSLSS